MAKRPPKLVALDHDDYTARYVGRTKDGRQFFLTTPFVPADEVGTPTGREFLALYLFDEAGGLLSAEIDDLGPRAGIDEAACVARRDELLASLGEVEFRRVRIAPYQVERFGVEFGFISSRSRSRARIGASSSGRATICASGRRGRAATTTLEGVAHDLALWRKIDGRSGDQPMSRIETTI